MLVVSGGDWNDSVDAAGLAAVDRRDVLVGAQLDDDEWPNRVDAFLDPS